ncbi:uncharacterized protein LOC116435020 [Nomia melanderi]|uniref:uncharacterized protein LOC116435020 n=1 Tax=Nomia melanderi TaxID=2448451 RepID=UPI0013046618|nr:uncharacterized protein LOC116435020 [Nomia melanderi]XP_031849959.1 uncharacterized protein LOC116435020 [Nomia melanderi]XP_031849960.1 uncharacterized protein LOC116435020 [Nomia melanderi]XP_031849961.1 uncharacterized protein LOC116435020 [Nomia melanderi]
MRRQSNSPSLNAGSSIGEPQIIVEESTLGEEEAEGRRNESPPRSLDPDLPSLNPDLLYPWRETRKHSLPTPQCTSGITASQVRRLSERGAEGSGPSPREAAFLATLSQAPAPQPGGRRHSVVTISKVPPSTLFGRNRRESIAAFPMGGARILPSRRDSKSGLSGPPSNSGSTHNLQLDIMDNIAEIKPRKVRLVMYKTSTEQVCEVQPLEGNSSSQRYTQYQKTSPLQRRSSDIPRAMSSSVSGTTGIVCSNTDLISILSSLASSATEINRCGEDVSGSQEESKGWSGKTTEQKRNRLKSFRSNSFDVLILQEAKEKLAESSKVAASTLMAPSNWFTKRHQPMSKKQKPESSFATSLNFKLDKPKVVKAVKETLGKTAAIGDLRHKVVWDDTSGTKVDAQVLGSAIEKILTAQKGSDSEASGSTGKPSVSPNKQKASSKVTSWFSGNAKEQEQNESCEQSICSSLKDLFVK